MFAQDFSQPPPGVMPVTKLPDTNGFHGPVPLTSLSIPETTPSPYSGVPIPVMSPVVPIRTPTPVGLLVPTQNAQTQDQRQEVWPVGLRVLIGSVPLEQERSRHETNPTMQAAVMTRVTDLEREQFQMASRSPEVSTADLPLAFRR